MKSHYKRANEIPEINDFLPEWAKDEGIDYVDLFSVMADENGRLKASYTWDGVHLTLDGYRKWVEALKKEKLIR